MREHQSPPFESRPLEVYYDGSCPLCRREIALYSGLRASCPVRWTDVSGAEATLPAGCSREAMLARFHVTGADGRLVSGASAFLALWERLPGWRWLARLGRLPGMPWLLERIYLVFLRVRPAMQRVAARFE